ncbi:MAG: Type 1 glutamine amidotransferase-like domain-containing protein [Deltaproteobacteria bacterium]|nr:Type 1 glutamine amidotransferase-like domain-containing protein [Deltaproteobacteria bacterium]
MGYILLEGGAEFGGLMAQPDLRALDLAGGLHVRLSIIPAAAAADNNHHRAGQNGVRWFSKLGATQVTALPLIDQVSANSQELAAVLGRSRLIYLLGGFPHYLAQTLADSFCWTAILAAHREGAVIAGSSAGAMVLCDHYYDPAAKSIKKGLNLLTGACVLPHHNTFGKTWASQLAEQNPELIFIGIDEETGMINDGPQGEWTVYGKGSVTLYRRHQSRCYRTGEMARFLNFNDMNPE